MIQESISLLPSTILQSLGSSIILIKGGKKYFVSFSSSSSSSVVLGQITKHEKHNSQNRETVSEVKDMSIVYHLLVEYLIHKLKTK